MAKLSDALQSRYLKQSDFPRPEVLTITHAVLENVAPMGQKEDKKYVLFFREKEKGLVLNATNNVWLTKQFGDDIDNLTDHKVIAYVNPDIEYGRQRVGGIRLREVPKPVGNSRFKDLPDNDLDETRQIPGA